MSETLESGPFDPRRPARNRAWSTTSRASSVPSGIVLKL